MTTIAIVQARMSSTRLPGKVLADLAGRSMLARVVSRCRRARRLDGVLVATSDLAVDDSLVAECNALDVPCFRGSEDDVLDRFYRAALESRAKTVVRITADCPLADGELIDQLLAAFSEAQPDYGSNVLVRTYPRGLDAEAMTIKALERAWIEAREPYERVHVTPYLYRHPELFRLLSVTGQRDHSDARWTVDSPEDLELMRAIYARLGGDDAFSWRDVLELVARDPALALINRHVRQKRVEEG